MCSAGREAGDNNAKCGCKVWIASMRVAWNHGFNKSEIREILGIVTANREKNLSAWENR
jgi:hypothetical protein